MILEEVERHREAHWKDYLNTGFGAAVPESSKLPLQAKFQYLTLRRGISYEKIGWLGVTKLSNYLVEHLLKLPV